MPRRARLLPEMSAFTLAHYPSALVHVACGKCDKRRCARLYRLIAENEPTTHVMEVLRKLAGNCPRRGDDSDPCALHYVELPAVTLAPLKF